MTSTQVSVEAIARSQMELYGRIARAYVNLRKSGAQVTLGTVESRLQNLEANWAKFESYHDKLVMGLSADALAALDYAKQGIPELAEEAFLDQKSRFLDDVRELKRQERELSAKPASGGASQAPRTTLPRIQLPQFSGKYEDWPAFRDLFQSIICADPSISSVEKLHYLRTSLKGDAELLVRNLPSTSESYEPAWQTLQDYYENKRLLVRAYLSSFVALPKMKGESASEMRKVLCGIRAVTSSMENIGRPIQSGEDLFIYLAVELLDTRSRREWENSIGDSTEPPSSQDLLRFLDRRLHTLEALQPARPDATSPTSTRSHFASKQDKRGRCTLCQQDHFVMMCDAYRKRTANERKQHVEGSGLCLNCLGRHKVSECSSPRTCSACGARHHSSLHDAYRENGASISSLVAQRSSAKTPAAVLLATARVRVADRYGRWHSARALIDQGSESSLVSERLARKLRLSRRPAPVTVFGVGGRKTAVAKGHVSLTIAPRSEGPSLPVAALVLPQLTAYNGGGMTGARPWPHINGLELADPEYGAADPVDLLLGAEVYAAILSPGLSRGTGNQPVAQRTTLGWILSGVIGETTSSHPSPAPRSSCCHSANPPWRVPRPRVYSLALVATPSRPLQSPAQPWRRPR